jgi:hypothetical protein
MKQLWTPVIRGASIFGVFAVASVLTWDAISPAAMQRIRREVAAYDKTLLVVAAQLAVAGVRQPRPARATARPAWDATWFVPVYLWGIEAIWDATGMVSADSSYLHRAVPSCLMLMVVLALCVAAEGWAHSRGLQTRESIGSLPLPVGAALVSLLLVWVGLLWSEAMWLEWRHTW